MKNAFREEKRSFSFAINYISVTLIDKMPPCTRYANPNNTVKAFRDSIKLSKILMAVNHIQNLRESFFEFGSLFACLSEKNCTDLDEPRLIARSCPHVQNAAMTRKDF